MKKIIYIFLIVGYFGHSQNTEDKLLDDMCSELKSNKGLSNENRLNSLDEKYIKPYLSNFSENEIEEKFEYLFVRLQKVCQEFGDILLEINPSTEENWIQLSQKPKIELTESELEEFKKYHFFYYNEYSGDRTDVYIINGIWNDKFLDGTHSKLHLKWLENKGFQLEFIESNNQLRKNFSKKGEKYDYEIIKKVDDYYWVLIGGADKETFFKFKLFIKLIP